MKRLDYFLCSDYDQVIAYRKNKAITFNDLMQAINHATVNIEKQLSDCYAIYCEDTVNFTILFFSLLLSRKKCILLPNINPEFVDSIRNVVEILLLDHDAELAWQARHLPTNNIDWQARIDQLHSSSEEICFFSSGSTGEPKLINKHISQLLAEVDVLEQLWGGNDSRAITVISSVSHQHLYGLLFRCLWPLLTGRTLISEQIRYPEQLQAALQSYDFLMVISSPALLRRLPGMIDLNHYDKSIFKVFSSGGSLTNESALTLENMINQSVVEVFGSTETGGFAWRTQSTPDETAWNLFPGVAIEQHKEALILHTPFLRAPYELDDKGIVDDQGKLQISGRRDTIVKIEEKRISLTELEKHILAIDEVKAVRVIALHRQRDFTAAVVVLSETGKQMLAKQGSREICRYCQSKLAEYFDLIVIPKKWRFVDELPINEVNKTSITALQKLFKS